MMTKTAKGGQDQADSFTEFLSPRLLPEEELQNQAREITENPAVPLFADFPKPVVIFTVTRQIVYANPPARDLFLPDRQQPQEYTGLRMGEALGCIHSGDLDTSLCGTTRYCRYCGAAQTQQAAVKDQPADDECRITRRFKDSQPEETAAEALDLHTWSRPFHHYGQPYILFFLEDISRQKRESILERFFYHDLINTVSSLKSLITLFEMEHPEIQSAYLPMAQNAVRHMVEEIHSHRDLKAAEDRTLSLSLKPVTPGDILHQLKDLYGHHHLAKDKKLTFRNQADGTSVTTDPTLLLRILGNMIKNGLEAVENNGEVTVQAKTLQAAPAKTSDKSNKPRSFKKPTPAAPAEPAMAGLRFSVHNPGVIPKAAQAQIFNRSYSTKGKGRGLGTYSMKLLGEYYLGGRVGFTTSPEKGTEFFIDLSAAPA